MREEFLNSPVNLIAPIVILNMCVFHENPHPLPVNRKLSRPRIVPGGDRPWPKSPHYVYERRTRGDFSRYSLLMGVLFSGAPGPPGTCHASLGSRTMLVTPTNVKESMEVRESCFEPGICFRYVRNVKVLSSIDMERINSNC